MRPLSRKVLKTTGLLQQIAAQPTVAMIQGSVKKASITYQKAVIALYNKSNLQLIAVRKPDQNGNYKFLGLNTDLKTFIVAFDQKQEYNAVIQDNVVPK